MKKIQIPFLLAIMIFVSCDLFEEDPVVLHPTTVIGPEDGAVDVSWLPTFVIGDYNPATNFVSTSYITIGDYSSEGAFMDYIIITRDTSARSQFVKLGQLNHTIYPYPPQLPLSEAIRRKDKAYYFPSAKLEPSTEYFWKVVHNAGDFELDVIPFRKFRTAPVYNQRESLEFVRVDGGTYCMGHLICESNPNWNANVTVDGFRMGKFEITNQQFCNFLNNSGYDFLGGGLVYIFSDLCKIQYDFAQGAWKPGAGMEDLPADAVQWHGALAFCQTYGGRLPTEAEWEFAAKGGLKSERFMYAGSHLSEEAGWFNSAVPRKVGTKMPNELGIYDMSGNVAEWCSDWYYHHPNTPAGHAYGNYLNPQGPESGDRRVIRGGSARSLPEPVFYSRYGLYPALDFNTFTLHNVGFRMVLDQP